MPRAYIPTSFNGNLRDHKCFSRTTTGVYIRPGVVVWNATKTSSQQPKAYIVLDECSEQPKVYIYVPVTKICLYLWLFDLNSIGCS